jgi:glycosyltransferase involved in cell wall biosynthesis
MSTNIIRLKAVRQINEYAEVGVVLLTKNGGRWLPLLLDCLNRQSLLHSLKVVVVDSGSQDETLSLLDSAGLTVVQIPPEEFSHSKTRNRAVALLGNVASVLFLSQDALPQEGDWLATMTGALNDNPEIDAISACEITDLKDPLAVGGVASHWIRCKMVKVDVPISPEFLSALHFVHPDKRRVFFPFTNVCALYRASVIREYPFNETFDHSEDIAWALASLKRGRSLLFTSRVTVLHPNHHSPKERSKRRLQEEIASERLFGVPRPSRLRRCLAEWLRFRL